MRLNISLFLVTVCWMALLEPRRDISALLTNDQYLFGGDTWPTTKSGNIFDQHLWHGNVRNSAHLSKLTGHYLLGDNLSYRHVSTAVGLAQSVERLTAERKVAGSIPGAGPILRVLKWLRNEGTSFALPPARPSRGSDDDVKWRSRGKIWCPQLALSC